MTKHHITTNKLSIHRYHLANKRRMVIYSKDLANLSQIDHPVINTIIKKAKLRKTIDWDYNPKNKDIALSLASAQAVLMIYWAYIDSKDANEKIDLAWKIWHAITDKIQGISYEKI